MRREAAGWFLMVLVVCCILAPAPVIGEDRETFSIRELIETGKGEEALKQIEKEPVTVPRRQEVLFLSAVAALLKIDEEKAQNFIREAREADPKASSNLESDAYLWAGKILLRDRKNAHIGLHYLSRGISFFPEKGISVAPLLKEAGTSLSADNPWMAHRMLERALALDPSLIQEDFFAYTYSIRTISDPQAILHAVEVFIKQFPESPLLPQALFSMAESHYMLGDFVRAKAAFQRIVKEFRSSPEGEASEKRLISWKEYSRIPVLIPPEPAPVKTGVLVEKGQKIAIGASGYSLEGPFSQGPEGRKEARGKSMNLPLSSAPPMALIGRIGKEGPWFLVGSGFVGTTDRGGELHLMMNRSSESAEGEMYKGRYSAMIRLDAH